ncbi:MAG: hypothetical protein J7501_10560 [Bdellovibrio sp.]|nr:hypothetical protein [Bdellovibrio sp.]
MKKFSVISTTAFTLLLLVAFQNCGRSMFFTPSQGVLSEGSFSSDTTLVDTEMNTPISFELNHLTTVSGVSLTVDPASVANLHGTIKIDDAANFKVTYTPSFGFRGNDNATLIAKDLYGNSMNLFVIAHVGNPLSGIEPALAVRGMGCIQCHANVSSNIITDFGYGNDYYFGVKPAVANWKSGSVYGDHGNSFNTMSIPADKSVLVPTAALPSAVATATGLSTVAAYVNKQFSISANSGTTRTSVVEKKSVYIGAPTDANLVAAFRLGATERIKYYKNNSTSAELSGLQDQKTFFKASGTLACDGDVVIRGPLLLDNIAVSTSDGCRLYVIGSVFMYGPVTYLGATENSNLQITSTRSISMGLGLAKKDNAFCEPTSRFALDNKNYGDSSLVNRFASFWTVPMNYVRQSADPKAYGQAIVDEAKVVEAGAGTLYDAACRSEGRMVSFERLLLNAPIVHSRYEGNFSGTIISEFAIMSLGQFIFSFDPVFSKTSVLPFLDSKTFLHIE